MRYFLMAGAACAALVVTAPVHAVEHYGPAKVGNQCVTAAATQSRDLQFASWSACPQPASTSVAPTTKKKKNQ